MEYVGGRSLKQILKDRMAANKGRYDPFPADQAIAYIVEILPAFSYLHSQGLFYCDFKPDNVIQAGDTIKLIDLGGVRRVDDDRAAIYGTVGFQAPEVADVGPSVASDIFTIGRTLAVLAMEFRGYQTTFATTLPPVADTPLFQRYDSLYRALHKATATEPRRPLPVGRRAPRPVARSAARGRRGRHGRRRRRAFEPVGAVRRADRRPAPTSRGPSCRPCASTTPTRRPTWLAGVSVADPATNASRCSKAAPRNTVEVQLAKARAAIEAPDCAQADQVDRRRARPRTRGSGARCGSRVSRRWPGPIRRRRDRVQHRARPGARRARAQARASRSRASETGADDVAEQLYAVCAATDANYVAPAAFGLARTPRAAR